MHESLPWLLGIVAALLHGAGYVVYNVQTKKGDSKPNVVSWTIWAFMAWLLWTIAYVFQLSNNIYCWNHDMVTLINPAVLLLAHASIIPMSSKTRKQRWVMKSR